MKQALLSPEKQCPFFEIYPIEHNGANSRPSNLITCGNHENKIVWLRKGSGVYTNGLVSAAVRSNSIFCLNAISQRVVAGADAGGFVVSFGDRLLSMDEIEFDLACHANIFRICSRMEGLPISCEPDADLAELIVRMTKENTCGGAFRIEVIKRYLKIFFIYLTRISDDTLRPVLQTKTSEHLDRFITMLEQDFRTRKMVSEYAESLFVTPNYLNEIVKKETGHSASYHIRLRIVTEAKRLALSSDHNMKQIAYSLGFVDCAHFSKFFKAATGYTFSDFKRQKLTIALAV